MNAHYYTIVVEGGHTIRGDVLIEESVLNEVAQLFGLLKEQSGLASLLSGILVSLDSRKAMNESINFKN